MAAEPSDGLGGPPGTRWRNPTDDTWYQWVSSLRKPCAFCLRRHGRLFARLPERPHPHCQCEFLAVRPGAQAPIEFRSAGGLAAAMPVGGHDPSGARLVGALNWLVRSAGLVSWDDLFDAGGDPRDFDQVVRRKGLTVSQLVAASVAEGVARRAVGLGPLGK
jgi:hypothetical protein